MIRTTIFILLAISMSVTSAFAHDTTDARNWIAQWIGINDSSDLKIENHRTTLPARYLRKDFVITRKPSKATLYISGLGSSYAFINGKRVGDDIFGPLPTWYDVTVPYLAYDVTDLINKGDNAIGVALGNGRYLSMRVGQYPPEDVIGFGLPRLIAEIEIQYADGSSQIIPTDTSWTATAKGPIRANNEYDGETYDASLELSNWSKPGYADPRWGKTDIVDAPKGKLVPQMSPSLKVMEKIKPISVKKTGDDRYIVDMGQNMVGLQRVRLNVKKGKSVVMRFAEVLKENGEELYIDNLRSALQTDTYIPAADGKIEWQPEFVYHGFRFMEISGIERKPGINDIEGLVVYDEMPTIGTFNCSNEILNKLHSNAYWGIRGNYRGMPTDCPQRDERMAWLGDRSTGAYGESFIFGNNLLYRKWLKDIEDSMSENGSISDVSPRFWTMYNDNVTWPASYFYITDILYRQFGDDYSVRQRYDSMTRWVNHMIATRMQDGIITHDTYGDWCLPPESPELIHSQDPARKTDGKLLGTAIFFDVLNLMHNFAEVIGNADDAAMFAKTASDIKTAYNNKFFEPEKGYYSNNTVTANLLSLQLGLVPENARQSVFNNIVERTVDECNSHVSVGVMGIQHLMRGLSRNGAQDLAYTIATNDTYPSWGYMIKKGATTIWELWNGDTADPAMNSRNHVMLLGDVIIWMYEDLAGIRNHPSSIGFKKILMEPIFPTGLNHVEATYNSPYGKIESRWKKTDSDFEWTITIPHNTTAEIVLPESLNIKLPVTDSRVIKSETKDGKLHFEITSGTYKFVNK